nr:unnamed protein product [Callosobruchus chinensis]
MVFCSISSTFKRKPKFVTFRDFKMFDIDQFNIDLFEVRWEDIAYLPDIESKIIFLKNNIIALFGKHCPIKTVRVTKPKAPWLTSNVKLILKTRNEALSKYKANPTSVNWNEYKKLRNFALLTIRNERSAFLNQLQLNDNPSSLYRALKNMHIRNNSNIDIPDTLCNPYEVNDYFKAMYQDNNEQCIENIFSYTTSRFSNSSSFSLKPIESHILLKIIGGIRLKCFWSGRHIPTDVETMSPSNK